MRSAPPADMTSGPGFDPYALLGVQVDADEFVIQLAYRARIREAHPDVAGAAGLEQAKRLNIARDWLLDPQLRAQLPRGRQAHAGRSTMGTGARASAPDGPRRPRWRRFRHGSGPARPFDAAGPEFGPRSRELRDFLASIEALTPDERARVNYSLGDGRAMDFEAYREFLPPALWASSLALREAVAATWRAGHDEPAPHVPLLGRLLPGGMHVANAYAQWLLLGDYFRAELGTGVFRAEHVMEAFTARCTGPWLASIGQPRYGPFDEHVRAFLVSADEMHVDAAKRLARSWRKQLGAAGSARPDDRIGPGVWLPAPEDIPEVLRVSGYLAAVDASRIAAPAGIGRQEDDFRHGLRLTAHVLAMGPLDGSMRGYLQPWLDAVGPDRSRWRQAS